MHINFWYATKPKMFFAGYILILDVGAHLAWSSPALSHLKSEKSQFFITTNQGAWLVSVVSLSTILGYVMSSIVMNRIGRRYSVLTFAILHLMSWIFINLARSYTFLLIARFIAGLSIAGTINLLPICIGEISEKSVRGIFLAFDRIGINIGAFLITTLGAFFQYKTMNLIMISLPILAICTFPLMSETPYYYLLKDQDEQAVKTQMKLSGVARSEIIMPDIQRIKEAMHNQNSENSSIKELICDRGSRKALIILLLASFIYPFSGSLAIQSYAQEIFKASGSSLAPEYATMIITGVQIFAGLPSTQLVDYWGRRPVYLFSGIMSAISLGTVGLFFFLKDFLKADIDSVTWLPLVGLVLYQFMCNSGITTIPTVYSGELFSVKVKHIAVMIFSNSVAVFMFTSKISLPFLNNLFGIYTTFWIYSAVCLIGPLIVVCIVPETKGKNLEEVLISLGRKKNKRNDNISC